MVSRCLGLVVVGDTVTLVDAEIPDNENDPISIINDDKWHLQKGDRAKAYDVMYRRCLNYVKENHIDTVVVKASALTMGSSKLGHLTSAEMRGVVIAAAAAVVPVRTIQKALISRTYGNRKVDEYLQDDDFWSKMTIGGSLRKGSREAAMLVIAARN